MGDGTRAAAPRIIPLIRDAAPPLASLPPFTHRRTARLGRDEKSADLLRRTTVRSQDPGDSWAHGRCESRRCEPR